MIEVRARDDKGKFLSATGVETVDAVEQAAFKVILTRSDLEEIVYCLNDKQGGIFDTKHRARLLCVLEIALGK